jgi:cytochrome c553
MKLSLQSVQKLAAFFLVLAAMQACPIHAQDVKQQAASCVACHPTSNVPANSVSPIIWGQNEGYVYVQLRDFQRATRASPSDAAMHALTQTMTDSQGYSVTPRLRGQTSAYLTTTINEFRSGERGNSPGMADFVRLYSAEDIKAIVAYLSSVD